MANIYQSMTAMIGNTPMLELDIPEARVLAKLEMCNPGGSVKDRAALSMLTDAKEKGLLRADSVIIEPTSGNTGIGLCAIAAAWGLKAVIVMPDSMSKERQLMMKAYGAQVVLTPGALGMAGAIEKAQALAAQTPHSILTGQFSTPPILPPMKIPPVRKSGRIPRARWIFSLRVSAPAVRFPV